MSKKKKKKPSRSRAKQPKGYIASLLLFFSVTILTMAAVSYLYHKSTGEILRDTVLTAIGAGAVLFLMAKANLQHGYAYDNREHPVRFLVCYIICLVVACISPLLPASGWPFAAVFAVLALFSNLQIGMVSASSLLMMSVSLGSADKTVFFLYFICGLVAVNLFSDIDESYKIGLPITISTMVLLLCQTAVVTIHVNGHWNYELFIIPVVSLLVNGIVMFAVLKYFSTAVVHKDAIKYMTINDQEYVLLVELKKLSVREYHRAVHTVHFCERIADKLGLDVQAVKTGGYYHRIGLLKGENSFENVRAIYEEHDFPPKARRILQEYTDAHTPFESKEATVLLMTDKIISTIMSKFENGAETLDYHKLIDTIFDTAMEKGIFNRSAITVSDLVQMREIFKREKLYYDFLH